MTCKQIVFTKINRAELLEREIKPLAPDRVLVKTAFTTISSGTERANITGDPNVSVFSTDTVAKFPRYCGYSASGVVLETGSEVRSVKPGDHVALSWSHHASVQVIPEGNVHLIESDQVGLDEASVVHIATFPMAAIRKCHLEIGESAVVMGLGILGLIAVQLLRAAGAVPVIAVDPVESRRKKALELGADVVLDPFADGFAEQVKQLTHGGANVAIEVTGNGKALDQVLDCMARFGRVALLGCTRHSDFTIDYYHKVHGPGVSLIGAHTMARPKAESSQGMWTQHDDAMALLRLCAAGRLNLRALIEETYSPLDAESVYDRLINEKSFPITQFDWTCLDG